LPDVAKTFFPKIEFINNKLKFQSVNKVALLLLFFSHSEEEIEENGYRFGIRRTWYEYF
jgi:hypothetical protein